MPVSVNKTIVVVLNLQKKKKEKAWHRQAFCLINLPVEPA